MKCSKPMRIWDKSTAGSMRVPCGRCIPCRLNFASMWAQRMMHEKAFHDDSVFVTLTYDDDHLPKGSKFVWKDVVIDGKIKKVAVGSTLCKRDVQLFLKRLRKEVAPKKVRYFVGGEYGDRDQRAHYHGVLFGLSQSDSSVIEKAWGKGFIYVGTVTDHSCNYVGKYVLKKLNGPMAIEYEKRGVIPEFSLKSNRPGLGGDHVAAFGGEMRNRGFNIVKGNKVGIPRFYKNKIVAADKGDAVFEQRRQQYDLDGRRKRLAEIEALGFKGVDGNELLRRQKIEDEAKGRERNKKIKQ